MRSRYHRRRTMSSMYKCRKGGHRHPYAAEKEVTPTWVTKPPICNISIPSFSLWMATELQGRYWQAVKELSCWLTVQDLGAGGWKWCMEIKLILNHRQEKRLASSYLWEAADCLNTIKRINVGPQNHWKIKAERDFERSDQSILLTQGRIT